VTSPTPEDKLFATVAASFALAGIELRDAPGGGYVAARGELKRFLPTLAAAEAFAAAVLDRIR
jgi:hypothetical protein